MKRFYSLLAAICCDLAWVVCMIALLAAGTICFFRELYVAATFLNIAPTVIMFSARALNGWRCPLPRWRKYLLRKAAS